MRFDEVFSTEYRLSYLSSIRQPWQNGEAWSCIGQPKEHNLLLTLEGCRGVYTMSDGREFLVEPGQVFFVPKGTEYVARFYTEKLPATTYGVNFRIFDTAGSGVEIEPVPISFNSIALLSNMADMEKLSYTLCREPMQYNFLLYNIFAVLASQMPRRGASSGFELINAGVEYLNRNFHEDISVSRLADMCRISEVYFRRLFKMQTGMSPNEYRTRLRIERAEEYLRYSNMSVSAISERLGFSDTAYFIKRFRELRGITPLAYRKG
jgi:AraC-like DNA-binding protein